MDRRFLATVAATLLLLGVGIGAGVFLGGAGLFDRQPRVDPAVTSFNASDPTCMAAVDTTPTVNSRNTTRGTFLVVRANVTVAGPDAVIDNATLGETGLANYTLTLDGKAGSTTCTDAQRAVVRTQIAFQLPHRGGEPFGVTVRYQGRTLFELRNRPSGLTVNETD